MSLGIPPVVSPVGVNTSIIKHKHNGIVSSNHIEWKNGLYELLTNENLRREIGQNAKQTILKTYSVEANKMQYLKLFE